MHWCARGREAARWVGNCAVSLLRRLAPPPPLSPQPPPHKRLLSDAHAAPIRGAGAICSFWLGSFRWVCPLCWPRPRTCWTPAPCVSPACRPATCCRRRAPWRARAGVGCFAVWRSSEESMPISFQETTPDTARGGGKRKEWRFVFLCGSN